MDDAGFNLEMPDNVGNARPAVRARGLVKSFGEVGRWRASTSTCRAA